MLVEILVWGFVFYLVYKFLFEFLLPIGKVAKDMKKKVNEMKEQQTQQEPNHQNQSSGNTVKPKIDEKDYIDFEEIK